MDPSLDKTSIVSKPWGAAGKWLETAPLQGSIIRKHNTS
jgi:hypothetical protein